MASCSQRGSTPAFLPVPLLLADVSTAGGAPSITTDVIDEMARRWRTRAELVDAARWAIIPDGAWEKARRFDSELVESGFRTMVFNELGSACGWLGIDTDAVRLILSDLREQPRQTRR